MQSDPGNEGSAEDSHIRRYQPLAKSLAFTLAALICLAAKVSAQDLEPRSFIHLPIDQNFLAAVYSYSDGQIVPPAGIPIDDVDMRLDTTVVNYSRTLAVAGNTAKVDVAAGTICFDGSGTWDGESIPVDRCGALDPRVRLSYNFLGAPALSFKDFASRSRGVVAGASLQVAVPLGSYNNDKIFNGGANRWLVKPQIGASNQFGLWTLESSLAATFTTDNDSFFGNNKIEQDVLYSLQLHVDRTFANGSWVSFNGNYFWGGKTNRNSVSRGDTQSNSRIGVTYTYPVNRQNSVKFALSSGILTRYGNDFDSLLVAWVYRWGKAS
jgi:hypothetical protein